MEGLGDPNYTAILGSTGSGEKIALLQFRNGTWYGRIHNAK
jgi:hypothetical protein